MNIANRIQKLEKTTGAGEQTPKTWVIVKGESRPAGIQGGDWVIIVQDAETKELLAEAGERTKKLNSGESGYDDTKKANR